MVKYLNITADATNQILTTKGKSSGNLNSLTIVNKSDARTTQIDLNVYDGTNTYSICSTKIPPLSNLYLDEVSFHGPKYQLRLTTDTTGGDASLTLIFK